MMNQIKVGCCGFPKGKKKYFEQFELVEIWQTFCKFQLTGTAQKWREEVPEDFEFSLKSWQERTYLPSSPTYRKAGLQIPAGKEGNDGFFKPTKEVCEAWRKTRDIAQVLKAKVIIFQCPAKFIPITENIENMRYFLTNVDREDFIFVWEPRGKWSDKVITALCQDLGLVHCVEPLESKAAYGKQEYFRLYGGAIIATNIAIMNWQGSEN